MKKNLTIIFLFLLTCTILAFAWVFLRWATFADLSTTPYDRKHLDKGVYLITYADGNDIFFQNQNALTQSALNRGIDFTFNYKAHHIDPVFRNKNAAILNDKAGAGRWLWKPYCNP